MKLPSYITLTGIDDCTTRFDWYKTLQEYFPDKVELGILISLTNKDRRYPSIQGVDELVNLCSKYRVPYALHLCGKIARDMRELENTHWLHEHLKFANSVQVNGADEDSEVVAWCNEVAYGKVILQTRVGFTSEKYHQLYDCSGGRGIVPKVIPVLPDNRLLVGYAGGISRHNVMDYISRINEVPGTSEYWLDMESSLRDSYNRFDTNEAMGVLQTVYSKEFGYE